MSDLSLMTAAEFERQMKKLAGNSNANKKEAVDLMCKALKSLGYDAGVNVFESTIKNVEGK